MNLKCDYSASIMKTLLLVLLAVIGLAADDFNPYKVLGVTRQASDTDIRTAFKQLSLKYHPDRGGEAEADRYARIVNAY